MSFCKSAHMVTLALTIVTLYAGSAFSAIYKVDLTTPSGITTSRTVNTDFAVSHPTISHTSGGIAFEVKDGDASCSIFLQENKSVSQMGQSLISTTVMVSILEIGGEISEISKRPVFSKSGLLTKAPLASIDQDVLPNAEGGRKVSVEAPKIRRSCTVSLL